jgi:hypothetical protein
MGKLFLVLVDRVGAEGSIEESSISACTADGGFARIWWIQYHRVTLPDCAILQDTSFREASGVITWGPRLPT